MQRWENNVEEYVPPANAHMVTQVFVPTMGTAQLHRLLEILLLHNKHTMFIGMAGTGKSATLNAFLKFKMKDHMLFKNINLNFYSTAKSLQGIMESAISKRQGRTFGPPRQHSHPHCLALRGVRLRVGMGCSGLRSGCLRSRRLVR